MQTLLDRLTMVLATFFFLGNSPFAPGTVGTLGGVLLYFAMLVLNLGWQAYLGATVAAVALGVAVSSRAERLFGRKDPLPVVIDEVASFLITMFMIPFSWPLLAAGFVLNRVLDIWKPFPARQLQNLPGGWGIMMDDVVSAAYSNLILRFALELKGHIT